MHPPLTPDDHRLIRNWTVAIAIIYPLLMLVFFASVTFKISAVPVGASTAANGPQTMQSSSRQQQPAEAVTPP
jgi:hypothetical protein